MAHPRLAAASHDWCSNERNACVTNCAQVSVSVAGDGSSTHGMDAKYSARVKHFFKYVFWTGSLWQKGCHHAHLSLQLTSDAQRPFWFSSTLSMIRAVGACLGFHVRNVLGLLAYIGP